MSPDERLAFLAGARAMQARCAAALMMRGQTTAASALLELTLPKPVDAERDAFGGARTPPVPDGWPGENQGV